MLDEQHPLVQFKLSILKRVMPLNNAVVFGDMYIVNGGYSEKCLEFGCSNVLLIDSLETPRWLDRRKANPNLNFYKGDFANPLFMKSFNASFDAGVAFEVLLHQAPLLSTLHLMLEKVGKYFCMVQPMLCEQRHPGSLVYLPGNPDSEALYPLKGQSDEYKVFDPLNVNQSHWIWGMTPSFLTSVLTGEGFEITHQATFGPLPNPNWFVWGCVAERKHVNMAHWSRFDTNPVLYSAERWAA